MKKAITILTLALTIGFAGSFINNKQIVNPDNEISTAVAKLEIPANVQGILDKSCIMCHNSDSKNTKGKMKLNFDNFTNGDYSTGKLIGKLNGIGKVLGKGEMPPEKFLANYPDKALTAEENTTLTEWAASQATALAGN